MIKGNFIKQKKDKYKLHIRMCLFVSQKVGKIVKYCLWKKFYSLTTCCKVLATCCKNSLYFLVQFLQNNDPNRIFSLNKCIVTLTVIQIIQALKKNKHGNEQFQKHKIN